MEGGLLPPKAVPRNGPLPNPPPPPPLEAEAEGEAVRVPKRPPLVVVGVVDDAAAAAAVEEAAEAGVLVADMRQEASRERALRAEVLKRVEVGCWEAGVGRRRRCGLTGRPHRRERTSTRSPGARLRGHQTPAPPSTSVARGREPSQWVRVRLVETRTSSEVFDALYRATVASMRAPRAYRPRDVSRDTARPSSRRRSLTADGSGQSRSHETRSLWSAACRSALAKYNSRSLLLFKPSFPSSTFGLTGPDPDDVQAQHSDAERLPLLLSLAAGPLASPASDERQSEREHARRRRCVEDWPVAGLAESRRREGE